MCNCGDQNDCHSHWNDCARELRKHKNSLSHESPPWLARMLLPECTLTKQTGYARRRLSSASSHQAIRIRITYGSVEHRFVGARAEQFSGNFSDRAHRGECRRCSNAET